MKIACYSWKWKWKYMRKANFEKSINMRPYFSSLPRTNGYWTMHNDAKEKRPKSSEEKGVKRIKIIQTLLADKMYIKVCCVVLCVSHSICIYWTIFGVNIIETSTESFVSTIKYLSIYWYRHCYQHRHSCHWISKKKREKTSMKDWGKKSAKFTFWGTNKKHTFFFCWIVCYQLCRFQLQSRIKSHETDLNCWHVTLWT